MTGPVAHHVHRPRAATPAEIRPALRPPGSCSSLQRTRPRHFLTHSLCVATAGSVLVSAVNCTLNATDQMFFGCVRECSFLKKNVSFVFFFFRSFRVWLHCIYIVFNRSIGPLRGYFSTMRKTIGFVSLMADLKKGVVIKHWLMRACRGRGVPLSQYCFKCCNWVSKN